MAKNPFAMVASKDGGAESMDEEGPDESMDEETDDGDEDGDEAAARSAMTDFLAAIGVRSKNPDAALSAFKELMEHC